MYTCPQGFSLLLSNGCSVMGRGFYITQPRYTTKQQIRTQINSLPRWSVPNDTRLVIWLAVPDVSTSVPLAPHFWTTGLNALTQSQPYNTQQLQSLLHVDTWCLQQQLSTMHRATAITPNTLQHNSTPPNSSSRAFTNNKLTTAAHHVLHINNELPHLWTSWVFGLGVLPFVFRATVHKAVIILSYYGLYNHL